PAEEMAPSEPSPEADATAQNAPPPEMDATAQAAPPPLTDVAPPAPPPEPPTFATFQSALSPYGTWINVPGLGLVWQPYASVVGADFIPYQSGGTWVYASSGWYFRSRWAWGWAPFHYGRWYNAPSIGWVWWPSYTW